MNRFPAIALAMTALVAVPAVSFAADAGMTNVLKGQDAFGGWQDSKPGVWRLITPGDLPKPYATQSASNAPGLVNRPDGAKPTPLEGFKVELVKSGMEGPRDMAVAPNGDIFVADSVADQIVVLRMKDGQAEPAEDSVFASDNLDRPYGIAFYPLDDPQWVYVGNTGSIVRFPYRTGDLKAAGPAEMVVGDIPAHYHWTRDIAFSPDGKTLYVAVGSASNVAQGARLPDSGIAQWAKTEPLGAMWGAEEGRASVIAFDPDGSNRRVYATGLRNCSGLTIQPATGEPWCVVNERDGLGDNVPSDYATSVQKGHFYGWPWYYIGSTTRIRASRSTGSVRISSAR